MLGKLSRSALAAAVVGLPLLVASSGSASAATAAVSVVTGAGTISGLNLTNPGATFDFYGSGTTAGVVCGAPGAGTTGIEAHGSDAVGSWAAGAGPVNIILTDDRCATINLGGDFARAGAVVVVAAIGGTNAAAGVCGFVPVQTPPDTITDYSLACAATLAGTA